MGNSHRLSAAFLPASQVLEKYKELYHVEAAFRVTKHDLSVRPIYHWKPERVKAHIAICFTAYALVKHMEYRVRLHLEGYTVTEIARITYHSPRAIDNYIGTFEAVLILYLYKMSAELMSRILVRSITLIREYLKLIDEVYKDVSEIKEYLIGKGVRI